jgi:hypothetical protein
MSVNPLPSNSPYARTGCGVPHLMKRSEWGLAAWCLGSSRGVAGGVCFGLGTNYPCRICPRLPATTDLLALAGTRR